jgi:hypothetical protein
MQRACEEVDMRELTVLGLDVDGKHIICEGPSTNGDPSEKFTLLVDDRLRAAVRGDGARLGQTRIDIEVNNMLSPVSSRMSTSSQALCIPTQRGLSGAHSNAASGVNRADTRAGR